MWQPHGHAVPTVRREDVAALDRSELQALITDKIEEGLFVEYKERWDSHKVARAVASFANSRGGGWLIVGMRASGRVPVDLVGVTDDGGLEERVVNTVRTSVAPVPAFLPQAVDIGSGLAGLVIQVPEGTQPPYILIRTGQVLIRTPASSEPIGIHDREALDRLFARGERGFRWATELAQRLAEDEDTWNTATAYTVPAADEGLFLGPLVHRRSTYEQVAEILGRFHYVPSGTRPSMVSTPPKGLRVAIPTWEDADSFVAAYVENTGIVRTEWYSPPRHSLDNVHALIEMALPLHRSITEDVLGHRGNVAVGVSDQWKTSEVDVERVAVARPPVPVSELDDPAFHESLKNDTFRRRGILVYEPEAE